MRSNVGEQMSSTPKAELELHVFDALCRQDQEPVAGRRSAPEARQRFGPGIASCRRPRAAVRALRPAAAARSLVRLTEGVL